MAANDAKPVPIAKGTRRDRIFRRFAGFHVALLVIWTAIQFGTSWNPWWLVVLTKFHVYAFTPPLLWLAYGLARRRHAPSTFRTLTGLFCVPLGLWVALYGRLLLPRSEGIPASPALSVLTYNVLNAQPDLGRPISLILQLDPDVLCLQEVTDRHAGELIARLSDRYPHHRIGTAHPGGTTALFSKSPWIDSGELALPPGRPAVWARIDSQVGEVIVVSAHLMHYWRGEIQGLAMVPDYVNTRTRWQEEQIEELTHLFVRGETPVILGMDGNLVPHSRSWRMLSLHFTDSAFASGWSLSRSNPPGTTTDLRPSKLDYLWARGLRSILTVVADDAGGSDHSPVMARFVPEPQPAHSSQR